MKKNLSRYLQVFINNGEVYIFDCIRECLLNINDSPLQGKIMDDASIDIKGSQKVSVNELGLGKMSILKANESLMNKPNSKTNRYFGYEETN